MGHGLSIRGDSYYCPLAFSLDSYWNCVNDCHHCYLRRLNRTWGQDLRPTDPEETKRKLINGLKNKNPKSALAWAIKQKKTIRFGNKADPFQEPEKEHRVSQRLLRVLGCLKWSYVVETMCTEGMLDYIPIVAESRKRATIMAIISPGAEADWELLERKRTTPIEDRFHHLALMRAEGITVAVNGEPFIPGHHTITQFEDMMKRLNSWGIRSYNTYNLHFNDHVAKRFAEIGIDPLIVWEANQDKNWKPIQQKLIEIATKHNIILGCPDFVNSGPDYYQPVNTCCGVNVPNPTTFNVHTWKRKIQTWGEAVGGNDLIEETYDGIGKLEEGRKILDGTHPDFYTMADAGMIPKKKKGFGLC